MKKISVINEPAREIRVTGDYEVVVVGGGISGVSAAVAAARNNARVCLMEKTFALGGLATQGNVTMWLPLCDGEGRQVTAGMAEELLKLSIADLQKENEAAGMTKIPACWLSGGNQQNRREKRYQVDFNPSAYLLALEKLALDSGVDILYDTRFCAVRREDSTVSHIIIENKDGRSALRCGAVIDATGDADVCFASGEETVTADANVPAAWFYTFGGGQLKRYRFTKPYSPVVKKDGKGPYFRGDTAEAVTDFLIESRKQLAEKLKSIREQQPDSDVQLIMPPAVPDFRMTRRLSGRFTYSEAYVHKWLDDTIGLVGDWRKRGPVYAIPFSSLRGKHNGNLLAVGRCISVDNSAWDALRVYPPCVVTGEAAGTAAAMISSKNMNNFDSLDIQVLQDKLRDQGVMLNPELTTKH